MVFLNSIWFWSALAAGGVAVPVVIHLLNRYRHKQIDWAAMALLQRAMTVRSRQVRLEDVLLLIVRSLAVLLLAMALARPTINSAGARWAGGSQQVGAVILVDCSYPMGHRELNSRIDRAKLRAQEVLAQLQPGDPVTLVAMGSRPRIILRNVGYDREQTSRALEELQALPEPLNLARCLEEAGSLLREVKSPVRECYIITDGRGSSWQALSESARSSLTAMGAVGKVFYLPVESGDSENIAITRFERTSGSPRQGSLVRLDVDVHNFGRREARNVTLSLLANEQAVGQRVLDSLAPGQLQTFPLYYRCDFAGDVELSARLGADALVVDNERRAVLRVRQQVRVLCVDGESIGEGAGAADYLVTALQPGPASAGRQSLLVQRIAASELSQRKPADFDVVILAGVGDVSEPQARALLEFVSAGGGLILFAGDRLDAQTFNSRMRVGEVTLLPAELLQAMKVDARSEGWPLEATGASGRLAEFVRSYPAQVQRPRIKQFFQAKVGEGAQAILNVAGTPWPLLVEKQVGQGRVLLCTTSANRTWTDLPVFPLYPMLVQEAVTALTQAPNEISGRVGQALVLPVKPESAAASVGIKSPAGQTTVRPVTEGDQTLVRFGQTDLPGFYSMTPSPETPAVAFAVNVDSTQSDVQPMAADVQTRALAGLPLQMPREGQSLADAIRRSRVGFELWPLLLGAGLVLLVIESLLGWKFSGRMKGEESAGGRLFRKKDELLVA